MIEDAPLLTIRRDFPRPPPGAVAALAGTPTGYIVDCQDGRGALDFRIKPVAGTAPERAAFTGVALTCHTGPADNLALFAAIEAARAGDVIIAATDAFTATAVIGDNMLGMARNRGIAAVVTDGLARDAAGILEVGVPVFCLGVSPNSPARNGPGTVGLAIAIGGVTVDAGDVVVGDRDGVAIVPRASLEALGAKLAQVRAAEADLEAKVKGGLEVPDFVREVLDSDRVRRLD